MQPVCAFVRLRTTSTCERAPPTSSASTSNPGQRSADVTASTNRAGSPARDLGAGSRACKICWFVLRHPRKKSLIDALGQPRTTMQKTVGGARSHVLVVARDERVRFASAPTVVMDRVACTGRSSRQTTGSLARCARGRRRGGAARLPFLTTNSWSISAQRTPHFFPPGLQISPGQHHSECNVSRPMLSTMPRRLTSSAISLVLHQRASPSGGGPHTSATTAASWLRCRACLIGLLGRASSTERVLQPRLADTVSPRARSRADTRYDRDRRSTNGVLHRRVGEGLERAAEIRTFSGFLLRCIRSANSARTSWRRELQPREPALLSSP